MELNFFFPGFSLLCFVLHHILTAMEAAASLSPQIGMAASRTSSLHQTHGMTTDLGAMRVQTIQANERTQQQQPKMKIMKRITTSMKHRENRKLAACYWALAAAGW